MNRYRKNHRVRKILITLEEIPVDRIDAFWREHLRYLRDDEIVTDDEDLTCFVSREYRQILEDHMQREPDRQHMVWFCRGGVRIGAASYCVYPSEDGKCFILDFWVFPAFRGNGTGRRCFEALAAKAKAEGAIYTELNSEKEASRRFWKSLGFTESGRDEYDMPLFTKGILQPE